MRYKLLGKSGLRVSELCLGTMTFGEEWGFGAGKDECKNVFDTYANAGGNFVDTANMYTNGSSEKILGDFIASDRDHFVVATKYTLNMRPSDPNTGGNHRKNLVQSLEASLKRLKTDYIDLYWVHAWDAHTPIEETMRALDDVVRSGKALYVGISDVPAWVVSRANMLAELRGWNPFVGLQIEYSLVQRAPERDLLPMAEALDIGITPWGILGGGTLSGKYVGGQRPAGTRLTSGDWGANYLTDRNLRIAEAVHSIAQQIDRSSSQVAIAWLRQQNRRTPIIPILGARTCAQLKDNLGALHVELTHDQLQILDNASRIELGFPHDFLVNVRTIVYGETYGLIDNHRQ